MPHKITKAFIVFHVEKLNDKGQMIVDDDTKPVVIPEADFQNYNFHNHVTAVLSQLDPIPEPAPEDPAKSNVFPFPNPLKEAD